MNTHQLVVGFDRSDLEPDHSGPIVCPDCKGKCLDLVGGTCRFCEGAGKFQFKVTTQETKAYQRGFVDGWNKALNTAIEQIQKSELK